MKFKRFLVVAAIAAAMPFALPDEAKKPEAKEAPKAEVKEAPKAEAPA